MALNGKTLFSIVCFFLITGIAFGIPTWIAMSKYSRKSAYDLNEQPTWTEYNNFVSIERSRFRVYNWRFVQEEKALPGNAPNFFVEMMCHSFKHDAMLKDGNTIVMTCDQGIMDEKNSYEILNGKKEKVYEVHAGSEKEIDGKKYSLIIYDNQEPKNMVAFVENNEFDSNLFTIKKQNRGDLIKIEKESLSSNRYKYNLRYIGNENDKEIISPMTASLIVSQQSFKKGVDMCNRIFIPFFVTSIVCFGLVILSFIGFCF